ncbi:hypothetical protein VFPPC_16577 [Pochonia chlamydosporia 170]|uniref:Uncharacterized protein n=1 Tax=Pochonia chlamydosporia 170 TaxID=1380566 RepID=A0A179F940_METCM|nr:hypothetical protein VFPPC_16577 [Pochonia chlamydosporia 170]OAQ61907.1 hypothetical protein VFPPC_16577 [Pochonia chlamydosporia 170]
MQTKFLVLGLVAQSLQVLAAPAPDAGKEVKEFKSVPSDKQLVKAHAASKDSPATGVALLAADTIAAIRTLTVVIIPTHSNACATPRYFTAAVAQDGIDIK